MLCIGDADVPPVSSTVSTGSCRAIIKAAHLQAQGEGSRVDEEMDGMER